MDQVVDVECLNIRLCKKKALALLINVFSLESFSICDKNRPSATWITLNLFIWLLRFIHNYRRFGVLQRKRKSSDSGRTQTISTHFPLSMTRLLCMTL